jgi:hypothetical protein
MMSLQLLLALPSSNRGKFARQNSKPGFTPFFSIITATSICQKPTTAMSIWQNPTYYSYVHLPKTYHSYIHLPKTYLPQLCPFAKNPIR